MLRRFLVCLAVYVAAGGPIVAAWADPVFVNGLALDGAMLDRSGGQDANTGASDSSPTSTTILTADSGGASPIAAPAAARCITRPACSASA